MNAEELRGILSQFDPYPWREPDEWRATVVSIEHVWYGPEGKNGDVAVMLEKSKVGFEFHSYQHVGGLFDEYDPDFPFLATFTFLTYDDVESVLRAAGIVSTDVHEFALYAAAVASAAQAYSGGDERMVHKLP